MPDDECQENTDDGQTCHVGQEIRSSVQHHSHSTRYRTGITGMVYGTVKYSVRSTRGVYSN